MDNSILPLSGVAVSLDIHNSTSIFESLSTSQLDGTSEKFLLYQIVDKVCNAINYALSSTSGQLVRFTGDGALLFFPEPIGMSSSETALTFAINFINIWARCKKCFSILEKIDFRVCLDKGQVLTNPDGGLWSGLVLNRASKIRNSNHKYRNCVTLSKAVAESLPKSSIYSDLLVETDVCYVGATSIPLFNIAFDGLNIITSSDFSNERIPICICLVGINTTFSCIEAVMLSISKQSRIPLKVILASSKANINKIKGGNKYNFDIEFIVQEQMASLERAAVRNALMQKALDCHDAKLLCFIDGDTILSKSSLEMAYNIFKADINCVFSMPRIDFDAPLIDGVNPKVTSLFLERSIDYIATNEYSYWGSKLKRMSEKETTASIAGSYAFLGSYVLFLPVEICKKVGWWDANFNGWGEEDVDFTYRIFLNGYRLSVPSIKGFLCLHLSHEIAFNNNLLSNARYLLSKYSDLRLYRKEFYSLLGL